MGDKMRTFKQFSFSGLDGVGACVSGLCLVHCVAMPIVLAFSPTLAHLIPGDEIVHRMLAFLVVGAGLPSFLAGFRKHRKWRVLATGFAGMSVILGALIFGDRFSSHAAEIGATSMGSLLLTTAHLTNRTFCRKCSRCEH
jgi:MerC mercury resistance protein